MLNHIQRGGVYLNRGVGRRHKGQKGHTGEHHLETQEERGVEVVSISEMKTDVFRSVVIKTETKAEP